MKHRSSILAALLLIPALASPQSLAEVARKEKERRKKLEASGAEKKVITEETLGSAGGRLANDPSDPPAVTSTSSRSSSGPTLGDAEQAGRERSEQEWRENASRARARVEQARKDVAMFDQMSISGSEYYADGDGNVVVRDLEHLRQLSAEAKAELAAAEKALADLETAARRASVPPGWLR